MWLARVFTVLGGYIAATDVITTFVAITNFRKRECGAIWVMTATGVLSIGCMSAVNFFISSDFKWVLFALAMMWLIALIIDGVETHAGGGHGNQ